LNRTDPAWPDDVIFDAVPDVLQLSPLEGEVRLAVSSADHDGDGLDDLTVAWTDAERTAVYLALASSGVARAFDAPFEVASAPGAGGLAVGLFGPDAVPDLLLAGAGTGDPGQAWMMAGDGGPGFGGASPAWDVNPAAEFELDLHPGAGGVAPLDLDHDGCFDALVAHVSAIEPDGTPAQSTLSVAWQQTDAGDGTCLGTFGSGNDPLDPLWSGDGAVGWAVPHAP